MPEELVGIVEQSMSAPVYELLKRPDELFVVEHAHRRPRFVEDSVRVALKALLDAYPSLADEDFVLSRQRNLETIHDHDVVAERFGTIGELRAELAGALPPRRRPSQPGSRPSALTKRPPPTSTWSSARCTRRRGRGMPPPACEPPARGGRRP